MGRGTDGPRRAASRPFRVSSLYAFLKGPWSLQREVHEAGEGRHAVFLGEAVFAAAPESDNLGYTETGELETATGVFAATRELQYTFMGPDLAEVRFNDGGFFHVMDLSNGISRVEHTCGDDFYQGLFRVLDDENWLSVWRVSGPRKNQVITTRYKRCQPSVA